MAAGRIGELCWYVSKGNGTDSKLWRRGIVLGWASAGSSNVVYPVAVIEDKDLEIVTSVRLDEITFNDFYPLKNRNRC